MFRLSKTDANGATVLTLEGQLVGEYTTFIEESCNAALSKDRRVSLQLNDVSTIDEAGRSLLRKLAHKGIEIRGSGIYTSYVVKSINAANETQRSRSSATGTTALAP